MQLCIYNPFAKPELQFQFYCCVSINLVYVRSVTMHHMILQCPQQLHKKFSLQETVTQQSHEATGQTVFKIRPAGFELRTCAALIQIMIQKIFIKYLLHIISNLNQYKHQCLERIKKKQYRNAKNVHVSFGKAIQQFFSIYKELKKIFASKRALH